MKLAKTFGALVFCLAAASPVRADPFVVSTMISTSGVLHCLSTIVCGGEGTNSITLGTGTQTATLTFHGLTTPRFDVTSQVNHPARVALGEFELVGNDGFQFPVHPANPQLSIVRFLMSIREIAPVSADTSKTLLFGPGGRPVLQVQQGTNHFTLPVGPNPFGYNSFVYTLKPFLFEIRPGRTTVTADVGVVPEPATMVLLGTGLLVTGVVRRRRKQSGA